MDVKIEKIKEKKSISELLKFSIINLDKPSGPTSFSVSQFVKNSLGLTKTAHFGTLDPQVSGVLPIALNRARRLNDYFMHKDKTYVGIMRLHSDISDEILKDAIKDFIGKITQLPPVRSRVKRAIREREIKSFEILERDNKDILFMTQVQAGTYIRKLCDDIGKKIGGAHMLELRRTKAGIFDESNSINLYDFEKAVEEYQEGNDKELRKILIPAEIISTILPVVQIKKEFIKKCMEGSPIFGNFLVNSEFAVKKEEKIAVFSDTKFIGCYTAVNNKNLFALPEFVFN